jgi:hypothetical protein
MDVRSVLYAPEMINIYVAALLPRQHHVHIDVDHLRRGPRACQRQPEQTAPES